MPGPFQKVREGEDITFSAQAWNSMLAAGEAFKALDRSGAREPAPQARSGDIVRVKNESGSDLLRTSILGLSGPIFDPSDSLDAFLREVTFRGVSPTAFHDGKFCVLLAPARDGTVAPASIAGACPAKVDVTDEGHTCCDVDPGNTTNLVSSEDGTAQILWRAGGTGVQWAYIRFSSTCAGSSTSRPARCDCPEAEYEVEVECGDCSPYAGYGGQRMPKFWVLTIGNAATDPYSVYDGCDQLACEQIATVRATLANEAGAYGAASCTWTGVGAHCSRFELTAGEDYWQITVLDREDCVLAVLRKPVGSFNCCGTNTGWELAEGSVCSSIEATLAPHPCTCCPETDCPPEGDVVCTDTACCLGPSNCAINVSLHNLATPPGYEDGGAQDCGAMNGDMEMTWAGDCTWRFKDVPTGATTSVVAELIHSGTSWTLSVVGEDGQTANFGISDWDCGQAVELTYTGGSCIPTSPAPTALFGVSYE